ncbi:MAG: AraC family transcriptional regulator [Fibrobacteres bacterium]|nr:AraC family transcriptional regulator [Fibrobacterota bacterium]
MEKADLDSLEKAAKGLPEPRSFFRGLAPSNFELPNNLILFQRARADMLGQEHHYHYRFVLIVNLRTEGTVALDNRSFELKPGEGLLVFPHQFHHFHPPKADSIRWLFLTFELNNPENIAALRNKVNPLSETFRAYLGRLVQMYLEKTSQKETSTAISMLAGLALLELMQQEGRSSTRATMARPSVIDQINRYIWDNFDKDLKLSDLAEKFPYSESHLRLLFRKRMGMSLGTYIQKVKMNRARSLLVSSGLNVSQVAQSCGYDSLYSFSRAFKKTTGLSPLAYKKVNTAKY